MNAKRKTSRQKISAFAVTVLLVLISIFAVTFIAIGSRTTQAEASSPPDLVFMRVGPNQYGVSAGHFGIEEVFIPEYHNGFPVTQIIPYGFAFASSLRRVHLSPSVRFIGEGAFLGTGLEFINLNQVEDIGPMAFGMNPALELVVILNTTNIVGPSAFMMSSPIIHTPLCQFSEQVQNWSPMWNDMFDVEPIWEHYGKSVFFDCALDGYVLVAYSSPPDVEDFIATSNSEYRARRIRKIDNYNGTYIVEITPFFFLFFAANYDAVYVGTESTHPIHILNNAFSVNPNPAAPSSIATIRLSDNAVFHSPQTLHAL